ATLTYDYFWSDDWAYEWKLDGERVLAVKRGSQVSLFSRNRIRLDATYPEVADALGKVKGDWWLDGEIVALKGPNTSFRKLQDRLHIKDEAEARAAKTPVFYYVFYCMYLDGYDMRQLPYGERRRLLNALIRPRGPLRLLSAEQKADAAYFRQICKKGWEGLIVKDLASAYESKRTPRWLKFKCGSGQEFIIIGYTEPRHSRIAFGALLLGFYEHGQLRYAGKVGTGFDQATLKDLLAKMRPLEVGSLPLDEKVRGKGLHWIEPRLVCEVGFTEWTDQHRLRHPRYQGLREDKPAREVIREGR
ncbi:MAG: non-homologous end-joining DNA ligase, partial [Candidatus Saccharimonadales bacterium]